MVILKKEKMLINRTHKIAAVYEQICPRPHILPPFFIHNFPCQLGRCHSLFFYFYGDLTLVFIIAKGAFQPQTNRLLYQQRAGRQYSIHVHSLYHLSPIPARCRSPPQQASNLLIEQTFRSVLHNPEASVVRLAWSSFICFHF